jgi:ATP-dependent exoDNAse (exonuclease V) beta subunit
MRLFYVGATRATSRLIVANAAPLASSAAVQMPA